MKMIDIEIQLSISEGSSRWAFNSVGCFLGGSGGLGRVMGEWLLGQWIVDVISFQKILVFYCLKGHIVEKG